jgi:hypothetical protein
MAELVGGDGSVGGRKVYIRFDAARFMQRGFARDKGHGAPE